MFARQSPLKLVAWAGCIVFLVAAAFVISRAQFEPAPAALHFPSAKEQSSEAARAPFQQADIESLQAQVLHAVKVAQPSVVAVRHTRLPSAASGVIISEDGLVLSQWHVTHAVRVENVPQESWTAGEPTVVILADGREVEAKLLGASVAHDLSLLKIVEPGPYPYSPVAGEAMVKTGDWVLKIGHPGHYRAGRPSMVRLGRVVASDPTGFVADCLINGGDSGGPYFDLEGRLVGIVRGCTADLAGLMDNNTDRVSDVNGFLFAATSNAVIQRDIEGMLQGVVGTGTQANYDRSLLDSHKLSATDWMGGDTTLAAFRQISERHNQCVAEVQVGGVCVTMATIVKVMEGRALLVAKASELPDEIHCRFANGEEQPAEVVLVDNAYDIAVMRVASKGLREVDWSTGDSLRQGEFAIAVGMNRSPIAVGVVSIPVLSAPAGDAADVEDAKEPNVGMVLCAGHFEPGAGYRLDRISERIEFDAGLRAEDLIYAIDGQPIQSDRDVRDRKVRRFDLARLEVERAGERLQIEVPMVPRARIALNDRSFGFPTFFEIDARVAAAQCGIPVLNRRGEAVGVVVARYDIQGCKAIPAKAIQMIVERVLEESAVNKRGDNSAIGRNSVGRD